ncbi:arginase family protein [Calditrichota bacterium]
MTFLHIPADREGANVALVGVPFDGCSTNRTGARFAPDAVRLAASSIETYSPYQKRDMEEIACVDLGDVDIAPGAVLRMMEAVDTSVRQIRDHGAKPLLIGGESMMVMGALEAMIELHPVLHLLYMDARPNTLQPDEDLYSDRTLGSRLQKKLGDDKVHFIGSRAGERVELESIETPSIDETLGKIRADAPIFLALSMNVFDPAIAPGVTNPAMGGMKWLEFIKIHHVIKGRNLVGAAVGDFVPQYDPSGVTAVLTASVFRELIILLG